MAGRRVLDWAMRTKRFAFNHQALENSDRWHKRGNVFTLKKRAAEIADDTWETPAQIKSLTKLDPNERLRVGGCANANITDRVDERLDPRGLDAVDYMRNAQILAHHSYRDPVGQVEILDIQDDGVHFSGWVGDPGSVGGPLGLTCMQTEMRSLVAQKIIKTVSVGFIPHKFRAPLYNGNGDMEEPLVIEQWELLEISLVAVPCNQLALIEMREAETPSAKQTNVLNLFGPGVKKEDIESLRRILG